MRNFIDLGMLTFEIIFTKQLFRKTLLQYSKKLNYVQLIVFD